MTSEGTTTFTYYASNNGGVSEHPRTKTVQLDETLPTVSFTGNAGTYTVDETVMIQCSASDALSGILSNDCADVLGRAYTFGSGTHTFTSSAVDFASNTGFASTTFIVRVTYDSLCNLTREFVQNHGVANSLCAKLRAAAAAHARGNFNARDAALNSYRNALSAHSGKKLTAEHAQILANLSLDLSAVPAGFTTGSSSSGSQKTVGDIMPPDSSLPE